MSDLWIFLIGVFVFLVNMYAILTVGYLEARDPAHSKPPAERTDEVDRPRDAERT